MTKLDKRRKYYLILDCETATLPYAAKFPADMKKNVAIAKPLIYDLGWQIVDIHGKVYKRASYLISEIFSVPAGQTADRSCHGSGKHQARTLFANGACFHGRLLHIYHSGMLPNQRNPANTAWKYKGR